MVRDALPQRQERFVCRSDQMTGPKRAVRLHLEEGLTLLFVSLRPSLDAELDLRTIHLETRPYRRP
jgi:hypothetical protein